MVLICLYLILKLYFYCSQNRRGKSCIRHIKDISWVWTNVHGHIQHRALTCNVILAGITFLNSLLFPMITSCSSQTIWWATKQNSLLEVWSDWGNTFSIVSGCITLLELDAVLVAYFVCFLIINWPSDYRVYNESCGDMKVKQKLWFRD